MTRARLLGTAAHAASLFAFWLLLSGIYTPFLVLSGLGASLAVAALAQRMEVADSEGHPIHLALAALGYWPWLLKEMVKSGWQVTGIILDPRLPISPPVVRFKPSQHTTAGLATHANSITLTPGTITVEAEPDEFLVHALTREGAAGVLEGEIDRRVRRMEGGA
jgi:multicomponent Na+:H+ antiporter subunit E